MTDDQIWEIMEVACDQCTWPDKCATEDDLIDHCEHCPLLEKLEEVKNGDTH